MSAVAVSPLRGESEQAMKVCDMTQNDEASKETLILPVLKTD